MVSLYVFFPHSANVNVGVNKDGRDVCCGCEKEGEWEEAKEKKTRRTIEMGDCTAPLFRVAQLRFFLCSHPRKNKHGCKPFFSNHGPWKVLSTKGREGGGGRDLLEREGRAKKRDRQSSKGYSVLFDQFKSMIGPRLSSQKRLQDGFDPRRTTFLR